MKFHEVWECISLGSLHSDTDAVVIDFDKSVERVAVAIGKTHIGILEGKECTRLATALKGAEWEDCGNFDRYVVNVAYLRYAIDYSVEGPKSTVFICEADVMLDIRERRNCVICEVWFGDDLECQTKHATLIEAISYVYGVIDGVGLKIDAVWSFGVSSENMDEAYSLYEKGEI
jgi:hypothetical protein